MHTNYAAVLTLHIYIVDIRVRTPLYIYDIHPSIHTVDVNKSINKTFIYIDDSYVYIYIYVRATTVNNTQIIR